MIIKDIFEGCGRIDQIAAGGVQHALWLAGGAGGIKDKQRIFRVHRFRLMLVAGLLNQVAPPQVAALMPFNGIAGALQHNHAVDAVHIRVFQRVVDVLFSAERHDQHARLRRR